MHQEIACTDYRDDDGKNGQNLARRHAWGRFDDTYRQYKARMRRWRAWYQEMPTGEADGITPARCCGGPTFLLPSIFERFGAVIFSTAPRFFVSLTTGGFIRLGTVA